MKQIKYFLNLKIQQATEIIKIVAQRWSLLSEEDKRPYIEAAERDKDRYSREMAEYDGPKHVPVKSRGKHKKVPKNAVYYYFINRMHLKE